MKTQTLVLFGIILGFLCFGYTQFAGKGDQNAELGFAVSKIQALKKELEGANTASSKFQEESMRMKHEADAVRESKTSLEVEIGPLRILQVEQQKAASELEEAKSEIKKLNKKLQDTETLVDQEKLVSKKSEDALEDLWVTHNSTKENLRILMSGVSADTRKQSECEAKTSELERSLGTAHTVQTKLNAEVQSEAERAKDFEDKYFAVKSDLAVVAKENAFLKNRIEIFEAEADRHVLKGDRQTRRKNLIEEEKQRALNRALDPDLAKPIEAVTWNIAAVNNNPFEYWISGTEEYNKLMDNVANFITSPGELDIPVSKVFTQDMWEDLKQTMKQIGWEGVDKVGTLWEENYKGRRIISELMKDASIGKKRLASMPDRVTNTIVTTTGLAMRPTVINCYEGSIAQMDKWWSAWKNFMFHTTVSVPSKGSAKSLLVAKLLKPIKRAKYPAVTEEEEAISLPLQTLVGAIFDAILVHIMNHAASNGWERIRAEMCDKLNLNKEVNLAEIINRSYYTSDVLFLQEVGSGLLKIPLLSSDFTIRKPEKWDSARNQNSVILLRKHEWSHVKEVTTRVMQHIAGSAPVADGDLFVLAASRIENGVPVRYLFASFHGDTNGLATIPVVEAVHKYASSLTPHHKLVFGMDANTYQHPSPDQQGLEDFAKFYVSKNLTTCYGDNPNPANYTTFHARTHLQTQLNKAVAIKDRDELGDKNPKDNIMFFKKDFVTVSTTKDNTGNRRYEEGMVFPTLAFPSDHGITSTVLRPNEAKKKKLSMVSWDTSPIMHALDYPAHELPDYDTMEEEWKKGITATTLVNTILTSEMVEELRTKVGAMHWDVSNVDHTWESIKSNTIAEFYERRKRCGVADSVTRQVGEKRRPSVLTCTSGGWKEWLEYMFTAGEDNVVPARLIKNSEKGTKEAKIVKLAALDLVWGHLHGTLDQEKLKKLKKNLCKTYSAQDRVMWALDKFKAANFVALQGVGKNDVVPQLYDKYDVGGRCMVLLKKGVFKNVEKVSLKQNITALSVVYKETGLLLTSIDSMWKADTLVNYALNNQLLLVFGARDAVLDAVTQDLTAHTSNPSEKSIFSTGIVEPPSGIFSYNPLVETDSYDTTALQLPSHHQLLAAKVVL